MDGTLTACLFDRARLERAADLLAVAVVASMPWSTTVTGILIVLWLAALLPTLDLPATRVEATATSAAFRFLRQPSTPITPSPPAKSGRAAGIRVGATSEFPCIDTKPRVNVSPGLVPENMT